MKEHIRQSNLIESIDDPIEDAQSMEAWEYLLSRNEVGIPELLQTHKIITQNQLKRGSGVFRSTYVQIGGEIAPSPWIAAELIRNLLLDLNERMEEIDPIEAHVRFEKAHPFIDGNGRTGRMLLWWHQIQIGEKPTLFKDKDKEEYYKLFR